MIDDTKLDFFHAINSLLPPCDYRPKNEFPSCDHPDSSTTLCGRVRCPRGENVWPEISKEER